ncbi:MAG: hypothetical protein SWX82_19150 [Cyanobacteriota bacterium]|nr:hypothetical protein [Cyanobacteriota bacterium]
MIFTIFGEMQDKYLFGGAFKNDEVKRENGTPGFCHGCTDGLTSLFLLLLKFL